MPSSVDCQPTDSFFSQREDKRDMKTAVVLLLVLAVWTVVSLGQLARSSEDAWEENNAPSGQKAANYPPSQGYNNYNGYPYYGNNNGPYDPCAHSIAGAAGGMHQGGGGGKLGRRSRCPTPASGSLNPSGGSGRPVYTSGHNGYPPYGNNNGGGNPYNGGQSGYPYNNGNPGYTNGGYPYNNGPYSASSGYPYNNNGYPNAGNSGNGPHHGTPTQGHNGYPPYGNGGGNPYNNGYPSNGGYPNSQNSGYNGGYYDAIPGNHPNEGYTSEGGGGYNNYGRQLATPSGSVEDVESTPQ